MGKNTNIEWTDNTVNFWVGCHKVSQGCKNCYMFTDQKRYGSDPNTVRRCKDATFYAALKWPEPRKIFTCSWSDFFIEEADEWRTDAWDVIRRTPQHSWQILTKRPERIADHLPEDWGDGWANVWLGTSVENQEAADKRIPELLKTPARVRFLSCEPMLGIVDLGASRALPIYRCADTVSYNCGFSGQLLHVATNQQSINGGWRKHDGNMQPWIDWIIAGGESGPNARPAHPDWFRLLRDQCVAARVPFFFKQHGEFIHESQAPGMLPPSRVRIAPDTTMFYPIGKKRAGRLLDGRTWDEFPEVQE